MDSTYVYGVTAARGVRISQEPNPKAPREIWKLERNPEISTLLLDFHHRRYSLDRYRSRSDSSKKLRIKGWKGRGLFMYSRRDREGEVDTARITTTEVRTPARLRSKYPQKQMPNAARPLPGPLSAARPVPCSGHQHLHGAHDLVAEPRSRKRAVCVACHTGPLLIAECEKPAQTARVCVLLAFHALTLLPSSWNFCFSNDSASPSFDFSTGCRRNRGECRVEQDV